MAKGNFRVPSSGPPFFDLYSGGRAGPHGSDRFTAAQIEQIRRTVRRVPEVMVKVTGGGRRISAVAAHLAYISQEGKLELESDDGQRVSREGQRELLEGWHLELTSGRYRPPRGAKPRHAGVKLVHNITLSMPAPTPPAAVLAAARAFAREQFGARHRYVMALHTHQQHPHVHLVVKAEGIDGRRLHIDKALLREWRQDFARLMREQGIAANATSRAVRGQTKRATRDPIYRAQRRGCSYALRQRVESVAKELAQTRTVCDPTRAKLVETRKAVVARWNDIASRLESQGEIDLGGDVRYFARHLPPVLTDRERLATEIIRRLEHRRPWQELVRDRALERTR